MVCYKLSGKTAGHFCRRGVLRISAPLRYRHSGIVLRHSLNPSIPKDFIADSSVHTIVLDNDSQAQLGVYAAGKSASALLEVAQLKAGKIGTLRYLDGVDLTITEDKVDAGTLIFIPSPGTILI